MDELKSKSQSFQFSLRKSSKEKRFLKKRAEFFQESNEKASFLQIRGDEDFAEIFFDCKNNLIKAYDKENYILIRSILGTLKDHLSFSEHPSKLPLAEFFEAELLPVIFSIIQKVLENTKKIQNFKSFGILEMSSWIFISAAVGTKDQIEELIQCGLFSIAQEFLKIENHKIGSHIIWALANVLEDAPDQYLSETGNDLINEIEGYFQLNRNIESVEKSCILFFLQLMKYQHTLNLSRKRVL